jgi:Asp-tRNA(Asn)/Glu-tRNA(Gln) amidotransferase A subunit family amidase
MLGIGALAKSVRDTRLINEIIAFSPPEERPLEEFSLVIPQKSLRYPIDPDTRLALEAVRSRLQQDFAVEDEQPPHYQQAADLWQRIMGINGAYEYGRIAFNGRPVNPGREYLKEKLFKSSELHAYFSWVLFTANMTKPSQRALRQTEQILAEGDKRVADYLDRRLLILPVYHTPAPLHGQVIKEVFSLTFSFRKYLPFVAYVNTWGLPALIVPVSQNQAGLPIGLQIISRVGNEDAIFKLGAILEEGFRGYKRCAIMSD